MMEAQIRRKRQIIRLLKESPLNADAENLFNNVSVSLTQARSNVARRTNNRGVDWSQFDHKCRVWSQKRHIMNDLYVNIMGINVFDSFRFAKNESKNVLDCYRQPGQRYVLLPSQLQPVYSLTIQKIYEGRYCEFWVKVLNLLIEITKRINLMEDFTGYDIHEDFLKGAIIAFLTQDNTNIGKFDLQGYFRLLDKINMNKVYIIPVLENLIAKMEKDRFDVIRGRKRKALD